MRKLIILCGWLLVFSEILIGRPKDFECLHVGTGQIDITPPIGIEMEGSYRKRPMTGVHDPLYAKALVIDNGTKRIIMVVCDLCMVGRTTTSQARRAISEEFGIPESHITISVTHTHAGPRVIPYICFDYFWNKDYFFNGNEYVEELPGKIVDAVRRAFSSMQPARLKVGTGYENTISFNRRFLMKDGTVVFNPGILNPNIVRTMGPIDPMVGILYFESLSGKPLATWVNFTLHTAIAGGTKASACFPYYMEQVLKKVKGEDMTVIFANGTCGDINHINVRQKSRFKTSYEKADQVGHVLAGEVIKQYPNLIPISNPDILVKNEIIHLSVPEYTAEELEEAKSIEKPIKFNTSTLNKWRKLSTMEYLKQHSVTALPAEVQVFSIGPLAIVFLPSEVFVEIGLAIKLASPFQWTFVVELTEDEISYIPTKRAFGEGSYEVEVAWIKPGEGEKLTRTAINLLKQLKGR